MPSVLPRRTCAHEAPALCTGHCQHLGAVLVVTVYVFTQLCISMLVAYGKVGKKLVLLISTACVRCL